MQVLSQRYGPALKQVDLRGVTRLMIIEFSGILFFEKIATKE